MMFSFGKGTDHAITAAAQPMRAMADDYDGLMALIGDARLVLLGEATHGTMNSMQSARALRSA